jgi:hypothetical protein
MSLQKPQTGILVLLTPEEAAKLLKLSPNQGLS